jgi:phosphatidylglycerol---prolipoprotein diacylglyceryl transferase
MMDVVAPGLLLAQGIGRIGNWWNQELFGKPTTLPWGLKIDSIHRPLGYENFATFHPTFLYELLWDFGGVAVLLLVDRRFKIRPPALFALYVSIYTSFRMLEETLRIDPSHHFLGMRLNFWVSLVLFVASTAFFIWWQLLRPRRRRRVAAGPKPPTMAIPKGRVR